MAYCTDIMTTSVVTCTPRSTITQAAQLMEYTTWDQFLL
jgi:CBS domain-containing protein